MSATRASPPASDTSALWHVVHLDDDSLCVHQLSAGIRPWRGRIVGAGPVGAADSWGCPPMNSGGPSSKVGPVRAAIAGVAVLLAAFMPPQATGADDSSDSEVALFTESVPPPPSDVDDVEPSPDQVLRARDVNNDGHTDLIAWS